MGRKKNISRYSVLSRSPSIVGHQRLYQKCAQNGCRPWIFLLKRREVFFTPVMEMKPNTFTRDLNCYADIQVIREKFWLQLRTLKSSVTQASRNYVKKWKNRQSFPILLLQTSSIGLALATSKHSAHGAQVGMSIYTLFITPGDGGRLYISNTCHTCLSASAELLV